MKIFAIIIIIILSLITLHFFNFARGFRQISIKNNDPKYLEHSKTALKRGLICLALVLVITIPTIIFL